MTSLPDHLAYNRKKNEEEPIEYKNELDILLEDLSVISDNRCRARLYNKIKEIKKDKINLKGE